MSLGKDHVIVNCVPQSICTALMVTALIAESAVYEGQKLPPSQFWRLEARDQWASICYGLSCYVLAERTYRPHQAPL